MLTARHTARRHTRSDGAARLPFSTSDVVASSASAPSQQAPAAPPRSAHPSPFERGGREEEAVSRGGGKTRAAGNLASTARSSPSEWSGLWALGSLGRSRALWWDGPHQEGCVSAAISKKKCFSVCLLINDSISKFTAQEWLHVSRVKDCCRTESIF